MEPDKPSQISFKRTFAWVVAAHLVLIIGLSLWSWATPGAPPPLKFISMVNAGDLVRGLPGSSIGQEIGPRPSPPPPREAPVARPPALTPQTLSYQPPAKPEPQPPPPVEIPKPEPTTAQIAPTPPEPVPVPAKPVVLKPRPKVKVDLQEISRNEDATPKSAPSSQTRTGKLPRLLADAADTTMSSLAIAEKLGRSMQASGVTSAVVTGKSGRSDGTDSEAGRYYTLIRDQMYEAWERPLNLLGRGLCTQVRIVIEKNGVIADVQIKRSSGSPQHDQTALAAVRKVGRIAEPLPDGVDGNVDINFKLTN
jgi:TonB family protein